MPVRTRRTGMRRRCEEGARHCSEGPRGGPRARLNPVRRGAAFNPAGPKETRHATPADQPAARRRPARHGGPDRRRLDHRPRHRHHPARVSARRPRLRGRLARPPLRRHPGQPHRRPRAGGAVGGWRQRGQRRDRESRAVRLRAGPVGARGDPRLAQEPRRSRRVRLHQRAGQLCRAHRASAQRRRDRGRGVPRALPAPDRDAAAGQRRCRGAA